MSDTFHQFQQIVQQFRESSLSIRADGPPTYRGEDPYRINIAGHPDAFRMLGRILTLMADAVETASEVDGLGWDLVLGTEQIPQLTMDSGHLLSLACDPDFTPTA